ncbi:unnamed protein product [Mytilus edulis]|uniref:Uncharacterized protein n=1 Tax=Mytilus edulis TaxID=6550 RepID=A0A8S3PVZ5_MYTED|nr:unnamed protein product [Mytilus edulis]
MIVTWFILLMLISKDVNSLSCVSNEAKKDFDDSRTALKEMEDHLRNTTKKLEESFKKITALLQDQLGVVKDALSNVGEKIKKVDDDFQLLGKDLESIYHKNVLSIFAVVTFIHILEHQWIIKQNMFTLFDIKAFWLEALSLIMIFTNIFILKYLPFIVTCILKL